MKDGANTLPKGVLLAEDEEEIRMLMGMLFELEGFEVFHAFDGQEALETFNANSHKIGVLVTDLGLPRLGGVELIEKVRALNPSVKIIGSSGYGRSNVRDEVLKAGGDEFFPKPFVAMDLVNKAKQLMGL